MRDKQEIQPKDIRKGDLIRNEHPTDYETGGRKVTAFEYVASRDEDTGNMTGRGTLYLLDRPKSREERAAYHLAGTLATIRRRKTGGAAWFNVDDAAEALASLRAWEAKNE